MAEPEATTTPGSPLPSLVHIPFLAHLGCELRRFDGGQSELVLTLRQELTNAWGMAHGGVTMTLLDAAMGHAARSPDAPGGEPRTGVVTIEMKTSFMRPGLGQLRVQGRVVHRTATMSFCEASVLDEKGALVAHGTGTFKHLKSLTVGGMKVRRGGASD